jgi:hypothetical protein
LQKYGKGIRAFKGIVAVNDVLGDEHLITVENTLTEMNKQNYSESKSFQTC